MSTQSVVIYSPIEDALYNGGMLVPLVGAAVVGVIVFLALLKMLERKVNHEWRRWADWVMGGSALVAIVAAGYTFHKLAI